MTNLTIHALVEDYLQHRFVRMPTQTAYRQRATTFVTRCGDIPVSEVTIEHTRIYLSKLREAGNSGATWTSNRRHFIALWRYALDLGYVSHNPWRSLPAARVVRSPKLVHDEHFRLALDEISRRETHFKPHKFWKLLTIFLSLTAIRRAQIVGMKWRDVILEDDIPHVI
jgi:integrase